ncbi:MAG TPA: hypothetical protein VF145_05100, partial [Chitinophagaceae bacterium]
MKKFYPLCLVLSIGLSSAAQITPIKSNFGDPQGVSLGSRVVFVNATTGELGSTDGTPGGTVAIPTASMILAGNNAALLNNKIIFPGFNAATGTELYISDGTIAGSALVKDINPGPTSSNPQGSSEGFTIVNNTMYFTADDGVNGTELWKTDGTTVGTVLVKDLNAVAISFPTIMGPAIGNTLFFTVNTSGSGLELWKSDGTSGGTVMVKEITAGIASTTFSTMFVSNGTYMFFVANDGVSGAELWRSDGTTAGTILLSDIAPGSAGSFDFSGITWNWNFHVKDNVLYFSPNNITGAKFYKTDGTPAGTSLVTDMNPSGGYVSLWDAIDWGG